MTLNEGNVGMQYQVRRLELPVQLGRRLEALGLIEGSRIILMHKKKRGAMIIKVRGTRFAIGYGISSHIEIKGESSYVA